MPATRRTRPTTKEAEVTDTLTGEPEAIATESATESDKRKRNTIVSMSNVTAEDADIFHPRQSRTDLTEYVNLLTQSKETDRPYGADMHPDQVSTAKSRFQSAAKQLGIGVSFSVVVAGTKEAERYPQLNSELVRLFWKAGPKSNRGPKGPRKPKDQGND